MGDEARGGGKAPTRYRCRACGGVTAEPLYDHDTIPPTPTCDDTLCGGTCDAEQRAAPCDSCNGVRGCGGASSCCCGGSDCRCPCHFDSSRNVPDDLDMDPNPSNRGAGTGAVDYDRVALAVASRLAARARCAECGKTMDGGASDSEDQPASHPDKAGRALCLGCWQEGNALCAGCERPFPHGELSADEGDDPSMPGDSYCRACLAGRRKNKPPAAGSIPCAYCCRPAGGDGLCGECRYEHGE